MTIIYPHRSSLGFDGEITLTLNKGALVDLRPPTHGVRIEVESGSVWVTQTGDTVDHLLHRSQNFVVERPGLVVVQALQDSAFRVLQG
jgi:hypothetical protein